VHSVHQDIKSATTASSTDLLLSQEDDPCREFLFFYCIQGKARERQGNVDVASAHYGNVKITKHRWQIDLIYLKARKGETYAWTQMSDKRWGVKEMHNRARCTNNNNN
jgi:hypothetical protein